MTNFLTAILSARNLRAAKSEGLFFRVESILLKCLKTPSADTAAPFCETAMDFSCVRRRALLHSPGEPLMSMGAALEEEEAAAAAGEAAATGFGDAACPCESTSIPCVVGATAGE